MRKFTLIKLLVRYGILKRKVIWKFIQYEKYYYGHLDTDTVNEQMICKITSLLFITKVKVLIKEVVPQHALIQQSCFGSTEFISIIPRKYFNLKNN